MSKNSRYARKCLTLLALTYNTYTAYQTMHLRCLYICCTVRNILLNMNLSKMKKHLKHFFISEIAFGSQCQHFAFVPTQPPQTLLQPHIL